MRCVQHWSQRVVDADGRAHAIHAIAYIPPHALPTSIASINGNQNIASALSSTAAIKSNQTLGAQVSSQSNTHHATTTTTTTTSVTTNGDVTSSRTSLIPTSFGNTTNQAASSSSSSNVGEVTPTEKYPYLLVAAGPHLLLYHARTGNLLYHLPSHHRYAQPDDPLAKSTLPLATSATIARDDIFSTAEIVTPKGAILTLTAIDYAPPPYAQFATASMDRFVLIWHARTLEPLLKYQHVGSVRCLSHNPVNGVLASGSDQEMGLWNPDSKTVQKQKVSSPVLCCAWSKDGQHLALGQADGHLSIRKLSGEETMRINVSGSPEIPLYALAWHLSPEREDTVACCVWHPTQTIHHVHLSGRLAAKPKALKDSGSGDPLCLQFFPNSGEFYVTGGQSAALHMYNTDDIHLAEVIRGDALASSQNPTKTDSVAAGKRSWIWSVAIRPTEDAMMAVGTQDGGLSMQQVHFSTVHGLHKARYAFRDTNMTDVVIQDVATNDTLRVSVKEIVRRISVFEHRLAVQTPTRILIYQLARFHGGIMRYQLKEKISKSLDCSLLILTGAHTILCVEQRLQLFNALGEKEREWTMSASIRYVKVTGGPLGQEGLLVGLKNGAVVQVFVNNAFQMDVLPPNNQFAVRCLDLSPLRTKIAVVDDQNICSVYNTKTKQLLYQEPNAGSVSWNTLHDDILCYSGGGLLSTKTGDLPAHQQSINGFVVGFHGASVYCLHVYKMTRLEMPQTPALEQYIDQRHYDAAFKVACLGVPDTDWRKLAKAALEGLHLTIARKSYQKVGNIRMVAAIDRLKAKAHYKGQNKLTGAPQDERDLILLADIKALLGQYADAARLFRKGGQPQRAIDMYLDLQLWDIALKIAQETGLDPSPILRQRAAMSLHTQDTATAAMTYLDLEDYMQAVLLLIKTASWTTLAKIIPRIPATETKALQKASAAFKKFDQRDAYVLTLSRLGAWEPLMHFYIANESFEHAFALATQQPALEKMIYLPYAQALAAQERYLEANTYFRRAGRIDETKRVLLILIKNAVYEERFADAGVLCWTLSRELAAALDDAPPPPPTNAGDEAKRTQEREREMMAQQVRLYAQHADLYYAYETVHRFVEDAFTDFAPSTAFRAAVLLMRYALLAPLPYGIKKSHALIAIRRQGKVNGAFALARAASRDLRQCTLSVAEDDANKVDGLLLRALPAADEALMQPICHACSHQNELVHPDGMRCVACSEPYLLSFDSFDHLPLVEFRLPDGMTDAQAQAILQQEPDALSSSASATSPSDATPSTSFQEGEEAFLELVLTMERPAASLESEFEAIQVTAALLQLLDHSMVFVKPGQLKGDPTKYYKLLLPEVHVTMCPTCYHFFHADEFEFLLLQHAGACPFCRTLVPTEPSTTTSIK